MVFKKVNKAEPVVEEVKEEPAEVAEEPVVETPAVEEFKPEAQDFPQEATSVPTPVFLTQADVNKMIYENNIMLRHLLEVVEAETAETTN